MLVNRFMMGTAKLPMSFHRHIEPHHHVTIWIASASLVVASLMLYKSAEVDSTLAENSPPQPSPEVQKAFGVQGGAPEQGFTMPAACKQTAPSTSNLQGSQQQLQSLQSQIQQLQQQSTQGLTPEQLQARQQQIQQLNAQLQQVESQLKSQQPTQPTSFEPSDDCKVAMVNLALSRMETMQDRMVKDDKFFGVLNSIDAKIAKIQSLIPQLQAAGVDAATINRINNDISTIQTQETALKAFFNKMKSFMASWIAQAKADPKSAFDSMKNGKFGANKTDASTASTAADAMIKAFQDLASTLDGIKDTAKGGT